MGSRLVLSLGTVGLALATAVAPRAEAQSRSVVTVCRDGTRFNTDDSRVCDRRGGVDLRATAIARRDEAVRANNGNNDGRWDDRRVGRNGRNDGDDDDDRGDRDDRGNRNRDGRRSVDPRYDPSNRNDPRYDPNNRNGGYGNGGYGNGGYGNGGYGNSRREVYEWQGLVDKEIQIQLRGTRAYVQPIGAGEFRNGRGYMVNGLPQQDGTLVVERIEGRGDVDVIEQPSSRNGYTATLRVRDPKGGAASYRIAAYWQPSNSGYGRYGRN